MPAPAPRNRLLASLTPADLARWTPQLTRVELSAGQVLQEPGVASDAVFFPETALVSLHNCGAADCRPRWPWSGATAWWG